jgi:hypothetical protein
MKKKLFNIIVIFLFYSCSNVDQFDKIDKRLFEGNSKLSAEFNFELNNKEEFGFIQNQIPAKLCNGRFPINTTFKLNDNSIETLLIFDRDCPEAEKSMMHSYTLPSIIILINGQDEIMLESNRINLVDLKHGIEEEIRNYAKNYGFDKFIAFQVYWDDKSSIDVRQKIFKDCIFSYQSYMQAIANEKYSKPIKNLTLNEIEDLKRNSRFAFYIKEKTKLKPPPPPPNYSIASDSVN